MNVLDIADGIDGYITACNGSFSNFQARKAYKYELSNISKKAEQSLSAAVQSIPLLKGCEMVILDSSADAGFPHTRAPKHVCLPASMCSEEPASERFKETLLHEAIHIHQRRNRGMWQVFLKRSKWTPVLEGTIPEQYFDSIRLNPDTIGTPFYAFNGQHVPLPLFPPSGGTLKNTEVKWFDIKAGTLFHEPPKEFVKLYGKVHQPEHPYEIYAEIFSEAGYNTEDKLLEALTAV
uniref:DUF4157 domain-containing protein n=1 Tax=viral metagenome TaxID=1070528 RepID=A0A6C0JVD6_9ZZZZ